MTLPASESKIASCFCFSRKISEKYKDEFELVAEPEFGFGFEFEFCARGSSFKFGALGRQLTKKTNQWLCAVGAQNKTTKSADWRPPEKRNNKSEELLATNFYAKPTKEVEMASPKRNKRISKE